MKPAHIVNKLLEADDPSPEYYLRNLPVPVKARIIADGYGELEALPYPVAKFDASSWFEQANLIELNSLAKEHWCTCFTADGVAEFYFNSTLSDWYAAYGHERGEGFEVYIDEEDAKNWVEHNRPDSWYATLWPSDHANVKTCILTGAPGEDPNDCTTHAHEEDRLAEADDPSPQHYIDALPPNFDALAVLAHDDLRDLDYNLAIPEEKRQFLEWIKQNEDVFPDVRKALEVAAANNFWHTGEVTDMMAFFEALGCPQKDGTCDRCSGSGEEPGAPEDEEGRTALCSDCKGEGQWPIHCVCDNTHQQNDTVCRWCWSRGRRHFNDPAV